VIAFRSIGLTLLCSVAVTACSGGGATSVPALGTATPTPAPVATASPNPATLAVTSSPATSAVPPVNGATGTVSFGAVNPPAGATIAVTVSTTPPAGVTALQSLVRRTKAVTRTTLAYVTWTPSVTIALSAFPQYTLTFPASLIPAGTTLHEAFLDGATAQPVYQLDIAFGPNGGTLTSTIGAPTLQAGKQYIFVFYIETDSNATAPPTATPGPTAAPTTNPSGAFLGSPVTITKVDTGFPAGSQFTEGQMTLASDGQLWLADQRTQAIRPLDPTTRALGTGFKFIPPGQTTSIRPGLLTTGVDGRLWITTFDDTSNIYVMSLSGTLQKIDSRVPSHVNYVYRLVSGSDGRMWGISADSMRVFTTSGTMSSYPLPGTRTGNDCPALTLNTDGNVWYACRDQVGKVTPAGVVTEFAGHGSQYIGAAPDGAVWIQGSGLNVGRVAPNGTYTEYPKPFYDSTCTSIVQGPDGAMYLGCSGSVFRIVSTGASMGSMTLLVNYQTPGYVTGFNALTVGPDQHSLWTLSDGPFAQLLR
jgi:streptogramin lyase